MLGVSPPIRLSQLSSQRNQCFSSLRNQEKLLLGKQQCNSNVMDTRQSKDIDE
jgi:hypothetical protein